MKLESSASITAPILLLNLRFARGLERIGAWPPMQTSRPPSPARSSFPPPPSKQSPPALPLIESSTLLPKMRSFAFDPLIVPEPRTRLVSVIDAQAGGLKSFGPIERTSRSARVAGTLFAAAKALRRLTHTSPARKSRLSCNTFRLGIIANFSRGCSMGGCGADYST